MAGFASLIWIDLECADRPSWLSPITGCWAGRLPLGTPTMRDFQRGGDRWTVLTDPAGHPFCLCAAG